MASTLLLDTVTWGLVLDSDGNIAVASEPYSLAQDAASAIKTFLGECYWNTTIGVPYLQEIMGLTPSLPLVKQRLIEAAQTVLGVVSAQVYIFQFSDRIVAGQVQVTSETTGEVSVAAFSVLNPQGAG